MNRMLSTLKAFLPGIFLIGFCIGTGSVTTMAKSGAEYGMSLLWTILISCFITYYLVGLYGKYTIVTGETALAAFRKHIHPAAGLFFLIALTGCITGSIIGVMGIVTDVSHVWSKTFISGGIEPIWFAVFYITLVYLLFLRGSTDFFQKALSVLVALMGIAFLVNFLLSPPAFMTIVRGLIPAVPARMPGSDVNPLLIVAAMTGTTAFAGLFIVRTTLVKEAGWTLADLKHQNRDAAIMAILLFIINTSIMATAAGTLHVKGQGMEKASQMITLLGPSAVVLFVIGIIAAGLSSQFPNILFLPWLLCDYNERERDMKRSQYRWIALGMSCLGFIVPVLEGKPILVMVIASVFGSIILPVAVLFIMILGNKKDLMKEHRFRPGTNVLLSIIFVVASYICVSGIIGLIRKTAA